MKRCLELWLVVFLVVAIFLTAPIAHAQNGASTDSLNVTATVPARTIIMVDQAGVIERVINNSEALAEIVTLSSEPSGETYQDNQAVMNQFNDLVANFDFNRYGEVYQRSNSPADWLKANFKSVSLLKTAAALAIFGFTSHR